MSTAALSRENAVRTALAILDREGAGALTMRRVAREMGVPLMSLYRHVRSKDDLEAALVAELVGSVRPAATDGEWDAGLRAWARAYREMALRHPHAAPLFAARPAAGYGARAEDVEAMLGVLRDAGLDAVAARVQLRATLVTVTGFCTVQAAARRAAESAPEEPGPDAGEHPMLAALLEDVRAMRHADAVFEAMVDAVVAGVRQAIAHAGAAREAGA